MERRGRFVGQHSEQTEIFIYLQSNSGQRNEGEDDDALMSLLDLLTVAKSFQKYFAPAGLAGYFLVIRMAQGPFFMELKWCAEVRESP